MSYSRRPTALINVASLLTSIVTWTSTFCLLWVAGSTQAFAQSCSNTPWNNVPSWNGNITVSGTENFTNSATNETFVENISFSAAVLLTAASLCPADSGGWSFNASYPTNYSYTDTRPCFASDGTQTTKSSGSPSVPYGGGLGVDLIGMTFLVGVEQEPPAPQITQTRTGCPGEPIVDQRFFLGLPVVYITPSTVLPAAPQTLSGIASGTGADGITWTLSYSLTPQSTCQADRNRLTALSQGDSAWGGMQYDKHDKNDPHGYDIKTWGCALTALTMAIDYANNAQPGSPTFMTPGDINTLMNSETGDFNGGSVQWGTSVDQLPFEIPASALNLKWNNLGGFLNSKTGPGANAAQAAAKVDSALCSPDPHPVIVGVRHSTKHNPDGTTQDVFPSHFVLVTGKDSSGNYTIIDPGFNTTSLSDYNNDYSTRGTVQDPVGDISRLDIVSDGNVQLTLIDSNGHKTGLDSASGNILQDIPRSAYYADALTDDVTFTGLIGPTYTVDAFQPPEGTYLVIATGLQSGPYTVTIDAISQNGTLQTVSPLVGNAERGSTMSFTLNFRSRAGATSTTTSMPGDRNEDGVVNCADLGIVKASFGKTIGQTGFDPRADVNANGVVNIIDLATVAKALPGGTTCP